MKSLTLILTTLFLFSSPVVWGEEVDYDDLVFRDGLYYKKFTDEPFSGDVVGQERGKVVKGKPEGKWTRWRENGQLIQRKNYKNGIPDGLFEWYYENGQLSSRGHYKNGKYDGLYESYYPNGQLGSRGHYKNYKQVGKWEYYNEDGTLDRVEDDSDTIIFENDSE